MPSNATGLQALINANTVEVETLVKAGRANGRFRDQDFALECPG